MYWIELNWILILMQLNKNEMQIRVEGIENILITMVFFLNSKKTFFHSSLLENWLNKF
jgi:hypothetical protein